MIVPRYLKKGVRPMRVHEQLEDGDIVLTPYGFVQVKVSPGFGPGVPYLEFPRHTFHMPPPMMVEDCETFHMWSYG